MARKKIHPKGLLDRFYSVVRNDYVEVNGALHHAGSSLICYCWNSKNAHLLERALTKYCLNPNAVDFVSYDVLDPPSSCVLEDDELPF